MKQNFRGSVQVMLAFFLRNPHAFPGSLGACKRDITVPTGNQIKRQCRDREDRWISAQDDRLPKRSGSSATSGGCLCVPVGAAFRFWRNIAVPATDGSDGVLVLVRFAVNV